MNSLRELIEAAAPAPWFWDSYDGIISKSLTDAYDSAMTADDEESEAIGGRIHVAAISEHSYRHDRTRLRADATLIALAPTLADLLERAMAELARDPFITGGWQGPVMERQRALLAEFHALFPAAVPEEKT